MCMIRRRISRGAARFTSCLVLQDSAQGKSQAALSFAHFSKKGQGIDGTLVALCHAVIFAGDGCQRTPDSKQACEMRTMEIFLAHIGVAFKRNG